MIGDLIQVSEARGTWPMSPGIERHNEGHWSITGPESGGLATGTIAIRVGAVNQEKKNLGCICSYLVTSEEIGWIWTTHLDSMNRPNTSIEILEIVQ
jgi:hypothetical protein